MYYCVYIMEAANIGDPLLAASIQYILNVVLTLPAIFFLDKWGRRPSLLLGSLGMMVLMFIVAALEATYGEPYHSDDGPLSAISWILRGQPAVSRAVVACSYLFVCIFAVTWGPVRHPLISYLQHGSILTIPLRHRGLTRLRYSPPKFVSKPSPSPPVQIGPGIASLHSRYRLSFGVSTGNCT